MAVVESPVTRKGSKVGSNPPLGPGVRSGPSYPSGPQTDSVPWQPSHTTSRHSEPPLPGSATTVIGPEDE
jgi:hypothetical protein